MPRFQGTEMRMSIAWLYADLLSFPRIAGGNKPLGILGTESINPKMIQIHRHWGPEKE